MCKGHFEESESKKKTQEKPGSIKCSFEHYGHKLISGTSPTPIQVIGVDDSWVYSWYGFCFEF